MRVLITGASGLLGREIMAAFTDGNEVLGLSHSRKGDGLIQTDLRDRDAFSTIVSDFSPDLAIHSAAYRDPDYCSEQHEDAMRLNVEPLEVLTRVMGSNGRIMMISSDYVFDGDNPPYREEDERNPVNFYGQTKCRAEDLIAQRAGSLALRVPVLIGRDDSFEKSGFVYKLVSSLRADDQVVLDDVNIRFPTWTRDVAAALRFAADKGIEGTLHYSGLEGGTQYQLALQVADLLDSDASNLKPSTESITRIARRPLDSQLSPDKIRSLGFNRFTPFRDATLNILD